MVKGFGCVGGERRREGKRRAPQDMVLGFCWFSNNVLVCRACYTCLSVVFGEWTLDWLASLPAPPIFPIFTFNWFANPQLLEIGSWHYSINFSFDNPRTLSRMEEQHKVKLDFAINRNDSNVVTKNSNVRLALWLIMGGDFNLYKAGFDISFHNKIH